jgi:50S ribosomal protein L16 3-hydroxylase
MDVNAKTPLLGGLSPAAFMRRHWQKQPLLVRQAWPGVEPPIARAPLFALAARDDVESRLVQRQAGRWQLQRGPLTRRSLPPLQQPGWTLLVQGLDLHVDAAHRLLQPFRFIPDARLDDLMVSWASPGGGVGPHTDAYDVFLLQVQGRRRWRVGPVPAPQWRRDTPLKMLRGFKPVHDWVLEPGDMLYLPPHWGHDGVAVGGDCMTCSVGFRVPDRDELARELLLRLADESTGDAVFYRDPGQPAAASSAAVPPGLLDFARRAVQRRLAGDDWLPCLLGEILSEPKPQVSFDGPGRARSAASAVVLSPRTRMLHDARCVYINGESFEVRGRDGVLARRLADERRLSAAEVGRLSVPARAAVDTWIAQGWASAAD